MNVMIPLGCKHPGSAAKIDVRDTWSLASLIENQMYVEKASNGCWKILLPNLWVK